MRTASHLVLVIPLLWAFPPDVDAQRNEYVIIDTYGRAHLWALPGDWRPTPTDGVLNFTGNAFLGMNECAAARPKRSVQPPGYHAVELEFTTPAGKALPHTFWLPGRYKRIEECPVRDGFHVLDDQTIIRVGAFQYKN